MFWNKRKEEKRIHEGKPAVSMVKPVNNSEKDEEKTIYQIISENIKDGRLPEGFDPIVEKINDEYAFILLPSN